jgi:hypothetical protein
MSAYDAIVEQQNGQSPQITRATHLSVDIGAVIDSLVSQHRTLLTMSTTAKATGQPDNLGRRRIALAGEPICIQSTIDNMANSLGQYSSSLKHVKDEHALRVLEIIQDVRVSINAGLHD